MSVDDWLLQHEPQIRLACFIAILGAVALWEIVAPCRERTLPRRARWPHNLGLVAIDVLVARLVFPFASVGLAALAAERGWGLLNVYPLPVTWAVVVALVILDLSIYLQHVMMHAVPALWRLHRVHHADLDYDVTTGLRFHPLEILLSLLIKFAAILLLGPPMVAVLLFEVILNGAAMFNHANARLPARVDRVLRWIIVTPDMHRVHHSVEDDEANSNFGFNLPWWDRLFGTYRAQPRAGHAGMIIGIHRYRDPARVDRLPSMLLLPFRGPVTGYAINRRSWNDRGE